MSPPPTPSRSANSLNHDRLSVELDTRAGRLRPPEVVMNPEMLGSARLTRYSFSRTMLRRAAAHGWAVKRTRLDLDPQGRGEAVYEVQLEGYVASFVAFTTTIDESEHSDRVIASKWEISGALVEGTVDETFLDHLRSEVPKQEGSRLDPRVLVLTRGNRSVRFFEYLVDRLANGLQPEAAVVGDSAYIMRSTAFYGNGKFGMRSFEGYSADDPLGVPYRAQFLCAWLYRELSFDVVESCARDRGGVAAVPFDQEWSHYFGLGNATGLGLVPYAFNHPAVINSWVAIRELALTDVRALDADPALLSTLRWWAERAQQHFATGTDDDCHPFRNAQSMAGAASLIVEQLDSIVHADLPFDALYSWAEAQDPETTELVVSLLLELHVGDDDLVDRLLVVDEHPEVPEDVTAADALVMLDEQYGWLTNLDLDTAEADTFWWVISDNNEEPRRVRRSDLEPEGRNMAIDVALRLGRLRHQLTLMDPSVSLAELAEQHPVHRLAIERLVSATGLYGEPHDNPCAANYLPLQLQRFQLAMYGMDNFKPKSTDWLRVTLFQGAPRIADLATGTTDAWVLPPRPALSPTSILDEGPPT